MAKGKGASGSTPAPKTPQKKQISKNSPGKKNSPKIMKQTTQTPSKGKATALPMEKPDPKKKTAAVERSTITGDLGEWLPPNYIQSIVASKSREEWQAKVRWMLAVLFFRCRFFAPTTIRSILQLLQPADPQVLVTTSSDNVVFFKELLIQLHGLIWEAHAQIAHLFLHETAAGIRHLESYQKESEGHRIRSKMTAEGLELALSLTTSDIRGLWTSIEYSAHSEYWVTTSKGSRIYVEALRRSSYGLMARIINHWLRGSQKSTEFSQSHVVRSQDFQTISDIHNPPSWPKPPARGDRPSSIEEWLELSHNYPSPLKNPLFIALKDRISKASAAQRQQNLASTGEQESIDIEDSSSESDESLSDLGSDEFDIMDEDLPVKGASLTVQAGSGKVAKRPPQLGLSNPCVDENSSPIRGSTVFQGTPQAKGSHQVHQPTTKANDSTGELSQEILPNTQSRFRSFKSLERTTSPPPGFPPKLASHKIPTPSAQRELNIIGGPSPAFQSILQVPPELEDEELPQSDVDEITTTANNDSEQIERLNLYLVDEGMDDEWYKTSQAAHIASLSSIGKAEYAMRCLDRDLERWSYGIWALNQRRIRDEQIMIELNEKRQRAIQRQQLIVDLEIAGVNTNEARMQMTRSHRLRDQKTAENRTRVTSGYTNAAQYSGSSQPHTTGISSSPLVSSTPAPPRYTTPLAMQRPASVSWQKNTAGMSSLPLQPSHSHHRDSTLGSPYRSDIGHDLQEVRPANHSTHGIAGVSGNVQLPIHGHDVHYVGTSEGPLFLGSGISSRPGELAMDPEERRKRKLARQAKREAKRIRMSETHTTDFTMDHISMKDSLNPANDEYYAQPAALRELQKHPRGDYTPTSESHTTLSGTPTSPNIGALRSRTPVDQSIQSQTSLPMQGAGVQAPPLSCQPMSYSDFSSSFDPQVRPPAQPTTSPIPSQATAIGRSPASPQRPPTESAT